MCCRRSRRSPRLATCTSSPRTCRPRSDWVDSCDIDAERCTVARMSVSVKCITVDCREPRRVAEFWAHALGWRVTHVADDGAMVEAPDRSQPGLEFIVVPEPKTVKNRVHLGLSTTELDEQ